MSGGALSPFTLGLPSYSFGSLGTPPSNGASDLVKDGWVKAQGYAAAAVNDAHNFLNQLSNASAALTNLPVVSNTFSPPVLGAEIVVPVSPTFATLAQFAVPIPQPYTSVYLDHLITQLDSWVQGAATGLRPDVEAAIWARGAAREAVAANRKIGEARRLFAVSGFTKPPGALSIEMMDAVQAAQDANVTGSRDVMIKQAELEQANRHFALETAWKVQEGMIMFLSKMNELALESVRAVTMYSTALAQAQAAVYGAQAQMYTAVTNAQATRYKAQVDGEVAAENIIVEVTKANVQAMIQKATVLVEAMKGGAQVTAQMAASALSAVSLQGAVHDNTSYGVTSSGQQSLNISQSKSEHENRSDSTAYDVQLSGTAV